MLNFFKSRKPREIQELNVVPIMDMLTAVIFFLLLTTTFLEFSKLTLPPSGTSVITDPVRPPPLNPKFLIGQTGSSFRILLTWSGKSPGRLTKVVRYQNSDEYPITLKQAVEELAGRFAKTYAEEKTVQLGLIRNLPYQNLIAVMDGAQSVFPDIVLISYQEAEARLRGT